MQGSPFRAAADTVALYVSVVDAQNMPIDGLTKDDFTLYDDDRQRPITVFAEGAQAFTGVLMLDMGGSFRDIPWLQAAGEQLLGALGPRDRLRIGTFGDEIAISPRVTGDRNFLTWVLREQLWPSQASPLWRALDAAMTSIAREDGRRVLIVLTNGLATDMGSDGRPVSRRAALDRAEREGFLVHIVTFSGGDVDRNLQALADHSGGSLAKLKDLASAGSAFTRVVDDLHAQQYLIGFAPERLDNRTHRISLRVNRAGAVVRTRTQYLAAGAAR